MMPEGVLLDTSFFIRFLRDNDPLFANADGYYRYFLEREVPMFISTISVAEFCVGGSIEQLPLKDLRILPFNIEHSKKAGEFARILFEARRVGQFIPADRLLIPNDTKLFSQADTEVGINSFVTSDGESIKAFDILRGKTSVGFDIINISTSHKEHFGLLNFDDC